MNDYVQKNELNERQKLLLEQINYSAKSVWVESSEKREGFSISNLLEHTHTQHKLVQYLAKEFRLE